VADFSPFAPGGLVLALGLILLVWLRRHDDRLGWALGLGLLVLACLPFRAALFGGQVLLPLDSLRGQAPFRELPATEPHGNPIQGDLIQLIQPSAVAVRSAWLAGEWPLVNAQVGLGVPLLGDPQAQAFQPLVLAALPLDPWAAPGAVAALRAFVALVFLFLLLRRLGAGSGAALVGAVAYGGCGFLQLWIGWPLATTAAVLPAVLYGLLRLEERGERRDGAFLGVATFTLLTAGHPQTIGYAGLLVGAFVVSRWSARRPGDRAALARGFVGPVLVAVLLAAPALLTFAAAAPDSLRASRGAPELAPAATRIVQVLAPNSLGNSRYARYWGAENSNEDAAAFAGTAALLGLLVTLGAALARWPPVVRYERAALGLVALSLGGSAFGFGRLGFLTALGLAVATAAACERLARDRRFPLWPLAAVTGLLALGHLLVYRQFQNPADLTDLDVLRWGFVHWHLRFAGVSALALALGRGRRWPAFVLALGLVAELHLVHGREHTVAPPELARAVPGPLAYLQEHAEERRIAAFGEVLPPNLASLYGLHDVRVYNPMAPTALYERLAPVLEGWQGEAPRLAHRDDPVYDELGVAYLLGAPEDTCPVGTTESFRDTAGVVCRRTASASPEEPADFVLPRGFLLGLVLAAVGLTLGAAHGLRPGATMPR
jgi:hypothetical protein